MNLFQSRKRKRRKKVQLPVGMEPARTHIYARQSIHSTTVLQQLHYFRVFNDLILFYCSDSRRLRHRLPRRPQRVRLPGTESRDSTRGLQTLGALVWPSDPGRRMATTARRNAAGQFLLGLRVMLVLLRRLIVATLGCFNI